MADAKQFVVDGQSIDVRDDRVDELITDRFKFVTNVSLDADDLFESGFYRCTNGIISNLPFTDCYLIVLCFPETFSALQIVVESNGENAKLRTSWGASSKTWANWESITLS